MVYSETSFYKRNEETGYQRGKRLPEVTFNESIAESSFSASDAESLNRKKAAAAAAKVEITRIKGRHNFS